jgi:hypothetical protein
MLHRVFAILALAAMAVLAADLKIDVTHKPDECKLKSKQGDRMSMQ